MSSGATQVNLGDLFATLIIAGLFVVIPVALAIIFYMTYKKNAKKHSNEQLQITALEKQVAQLQKRIDELEK
ncbi:MAG: hypothetical protein ABS942_06295 [Solibacillus sp.]|uniref:hypothetical protein n=1 Tax=Solibacillus sp. FSL H8-0523 TaxID=2954511 RepID=UPI003101B273